MTAREKLAARIAEIPTANLIDMTRILATGTTAEEILTATMIDNELESRLPAAEFLALMGEVESLMDAA